MEDSGTRQQFETGAVRDTEDGKSRPDLISPLAALRLGDWLAKGAKKYAERNWEQGMGISRCIASLERHLQKYKAGYEEEDHLIAVMCNAMFAVHYEEMIKLGKLPETLDDLPKYAKESHDMQSLKPKSGVRCLDTKLQYLKIQKSIGLIYVASPFSTPKRDADMAPVMRKRADWVSAWTAAAIEEGYRVYSPIVHSYGLKGFLKEEHNSFEYWKEQDLAILQRADALICLNLPDAFASESNGVRNELEAWDQMPNIRHSLILTPLFSDSI